MKIYTKEEFKTVDTVTTSKLNVSDYDKAMEDHLYQERCARGYTTREPSSPNYLNGSNPRWKQDALDWIDHVQAVMEYGLTVQNSYIAGEEVPTLEEFKNNLPKITWTLNMTE